MIWPVRLVTVAIVVSPMLVACGSSTGNKLSPDASYFEGLPSPVVNEALANPTLKQNLEGQSGAAAEGLAQAAIRNIIFCREELHVYRQWIATGSPPAITSGPLPAHPLEPGNIEIGQAYVGLKQVVQAGDPTRLRVSLTGDGSCGQWVPATPGDTKGPTIAQILK